MQATGRDVGREQLVEDGESNAGLVAEFGDGAVARVEERVGARGVGQRKVSRVVIAHAAAEGLVTFRAAEGFDLRVFVGRDGLGGELAADPIGFFGHDDAEARTGRRERGGDATHTAADDDEIDRAFFGGGQRAGWG